MEEVKTAEVTVVLFESIENYTFCIKFELIDNTPSCSIYAAIAEFVETQEGTEEDYNLVDSDGNIVEGFENAQHIASISDVHSFENELFFSINFNGSYWMNYSELEALHELIEEYVKPELADFKIDKFND